MKFSTAFLALSLLPCVFASAEDAPVSAKTKPLTAERQAIHDAAQTFCTELRKEPVQGLPNASQWKRLAPLLTPELRSIIERAQTQQKEQIRRYPDEKPAWIEGDHFSSSFEGVTSWELGEVFTAPTVDTSVKVHQTYRDKETISWTDTLVFKKRKNRWLLDDVRMGAKWDFRMGPTLRKMLPGGFQESQNHDSPDERWHVEFTRDAEEVTRITIEPKDKSTKPTILFGNNDESCPMPTWVIWNPRSDMLAIRLGDGPRFTRTLIYRYVGERWQPVKMPPLYPVERKTLASHGFHERHSLIDAERWQNDNELVVQYFGNFTKEDEGDGFHKFVTIQVPTRGAASVLGAVDVPGAD